MTDYFEKGINYKFEVSAEAAEYIQVWVGRDYPQTKVTMALVLKGLTDAQNYVLANRLPEGYSKEDYLVHKVEYTVELIKDGEIFFSMS